MSTIFQEKGSGLDAARNEYLAPEILVECVKCHNVVCISYNGAPATMDWNEDNGNNWE